MESECPIDAELRREISTLLEAPPPAQVEHYLNQLIQTRQCHAITVKHNGHLGKGVYAVSDLEGDELVLKDQMLVGHQHYSNKIECLVCSFCFRFVGLLSSKSGGGFIFKNWEFLPIVVLNLMRKKKRSWGNVVRAVQLTKIRFHFLKDLQRL
ncbi:hypothetical protein ACLB2K_067507 [Fragaria x ananassa]